MNQQISLFEQPAPCYCMTLEEMRQHEWVVSWSGGKDSTATIILMHELKVPIKYIVTVLMMYDKNTPAILPIMYDFIFKAKAVFEEWGYKVLTPKSPRYAKDNCLQVFTIKSKRADLWGKTYGARAFLGGV